jgi:hypothetical protein
MSHGKNLSSTSVNLNLLGDPNLDDWIESLHCLKSSGLYFPGDGQPIVLWNLISDSPIDCGLDPISDSPIVSGIIQSDIRYSDSLIAEKIAVQ